MKREMYKRVMRVVFKKRSKVIKSEKLFYASFDFFPIFECFKNVPIGL
jgi:hypothetical protein